MSGRDSDFDADDEKHAAPGDRLMVSVEPDRLLVGEALAQLSAADRGVLRRSYYQGWTTAQIAHDLHIPEGTVKMKLHYAVRALQRRLQEMGSELDSPAAELGPNVTPVRGDVANLDDLDPLNTTIKTAAKRLDIVVANAAFHAIGRCPTERLREPVNEGVYPS